MPAPSLVLNRSSPICWISACGRVLITGSRNASVNPKPSIA